MCYSDMKNTFLLILIIFFHAYAPIYLTIVKCPYLVKNGTKYGHFSGRE